MKIPSMKTYLPHSCSDQILANILNTNGLVQADTETHLGIYGSLIGAIPEFRTTLIQNTTFHPE